MLTVVCWKWAPRDPYRSTFGPETVNTLRNMVARYYQKPHRFVCVTDNSQGIDPRVEIVKLWKDHSGLVHPTGPANPSCYRRLKMFAADAGDIFGDRLVSVDLDCVITGDLSPLWDRPEDFVMWGDTNPTTPYNGSMVLLRTGSRPQVWDEFNANPLKAIARAKKLNYFGSDQAVIGAILGPNEPKWSKADGVLSYRIDVRRRKPDDGSLPDGARIVFLHGAEDPWMKSVQTRHPWVAEHYR